MQQLIRELAGICAIAALSSGLLEGTRWMGTMRFIIGLRLVKILAGMAAEFAHMFK